ncbi:cysteine proteinase [Amylocystis lapponica]|nr:cysteine proteinase [Amylocystis lapponica]
MAPLTVKIKHAGKVHDVPLNPDEPPTVFKNSVYQVTGVPTDRMKVMIKGGVLKDDTDWRKVGPKEGQTFMVIGAAGELPKPPSEPVVFLEDMDDAALAEALALPVGLINLGNTCYMNATLQAMRAIPELQTALASSAPPGLPATLQNLYTQMGRTTDSITPTGFLTALRAAFPQFAERSRVGPKGLGGMGCWIQVTNALKDVPGLPGPSSGTVSASARFVDQYMTGEMRRELKCDEAPEEPVTVSAEKVLKIECNISVSTNYMLSGIMAALDGKIEKNSPTLGRTAVYSSKSRLSRLPAYLTVHMMRFAWRQDIQKKAKIMRKVKFPTDFDAFDLATDDLKARMLPVTTKLKQVESDRRERLKVRRHPGTCGPGRDGSRADPSLGELEDESVYRTRESAELDALVHSDLKADVGCSVSGQYELVAIVTHKGAAADAGHYIGFVKKSALGALQTSADDEDWYKFDDDRVSLFPKEKLATLDGGGEDSSAYVLLYKTKTW